MTIERRMNPRFRVTTEIIAAIETEHARYAGQLVDISTGGFLLRVIWNLSSGKKQQEPGMQATGEFLVGDRLVKMEGALARIEKGQVGIRLAKPLLQSVIDEVVQGQSGAVQRINGHVRVVGAFNITVLHDVMRAVRAKKIIDLSGVTGIDSAGLGMASLALEREGVIEKCSFVIRGTMRMARICDSCQGTCTEPNPRKTKPAKTAGSVTV